MNIKSSVPKETKKSKNTKEKGTLQDVNEGWPGSQFTVSVGPYDVMARLTQLPTLQDIDVRNQVIDLHVFVVPLELWVEKYRTVYNHAVLESTSAGFIRVASSFTLYDLRKYIEEQLGHEIVPDNYIFLRSVGRCLAVVNEGQEHFLTAKEFSPPEAYSPELFLLPCTHKDLVLNHQDIIERTTDTYDKQSDKRLNRTILNDKNDVPFVHSSSLNKINNDNDSITQSPHNDSITQSPQTKQNKNTQPKQNRNSYNIMKVEPPSSTTSPDTDETDSNNNGSASSGKSYTILQPELALVNSDASKTLFPLPSARVISRQQSRNQSSKRGMSSKDSNMLVDVPRITMTTTPDNGWENNDGRRQNEAAERKKKALHKTLTSKIRSSRDENVDPALIALETRMKKRYEEEQQRLQRLENENNETDQENEKVESGSVDDGQDFNDTENKNGYTEEQKMLHDRKKSQDSSPNHNKLYRQNVADSESENESENEEDEDREEEEEGSIIDKNVDVRHQNKENVADTHGSMENKSNNKKTKSKSNSYHIKKDTKVPQKDIVDDNDVLNKIHEIEEIRKQNKEKQKQKEIEEQERMKNQVEMTAMKKQKIDEMKRELEKVRAEKHSFRKEREYLVKKQRSHQVELNSKLNQKNNAWRKKFVEERKRTAYLEEAIMKTKNEIEAQHRKLYSTPPDHNDHHNLGQKELLHGGQPSERNNQKNMLIRLQRQNEELKTRIEMMTKNLAVETKKRNMSQQELKDLRQKALEVKINANRAKKILSPPAK